MSGTLRTLLGARAAAVVGRQAERAVLLDLAERDRPLVVAVHGIAGIGKSALLAAFAEDARAHGAAVVSLDCGGIEPTERGFLAALDRAIGALRAEPPGGTRPMATVAEAAAALSGLGDRVVLVLDTYEQLRLLDTWLRQELVPGLRDNTRLALAGREPPVAAWISDFGDLLATVPLANLAAADAGALLRREGLSGADAARITRFTHGHPLALRLAASARGARPDLTVPDAAVATVVTELARVYLSGLDQPTRAVLDAACTLRLADPVAPRCPAAGCPPARRLRHAAPAAVRGVRTGRPGPARHRARSRRGAAAGQRSAGLPRPPDRGLAATAARAAHRPAGGPVALHRRPALPHREPGRAGGVLPHRQLPVRGRAGAAGR